MAVTLMGLMAVLLGRRLKRYAWLPATGGVTFVVSDSLFALYLLDGTESLALSQLVWITYFLAQCLITHAAALPRRMVSYEPGGLARSQ
jgi:hypothetical protein